MIWLHLYAFYNLSAFVGLLDITKGLQWSAAPPLPNIAMAGVQAELGETVDRGSNPQAPSMLAWAERKQPC